MKNGRGTLALLGLSVVFVVLVGAALIAQVAYDARHAETQVATVERILDEQKICSDTDQEHCRQLFERLSDNISPRQRERLACSVVLYLHGAEIAPGIECPKRLSP